MKSALRYIGPLVVLLLCSACANQGPVVRSPDVRLDGVRLQSISLGKQTFLLSFNVSNPNPFPLPVKGLSYRVLLDEQQFASGKTAGRFDIPASGDGAFSISVDLDLINSAAGLTSILGSAAARPVPYALDGSLEVAIPFTRPLSFRSDGTIMVRGRQ
ncbi:MAG: LEA type 2 family protein [Woeseia sp.]